MFNGKLLMRIKDSIIILQEQPPPKVEVSSKEN